MNTFKRGASLWVLSLVGVLLAASGCSKTTLSNSWMDPAYKSKTIKKVMVIGLAKDPSMRRMFETRMSAIFEKQGVPAVASFTIMPDLATAEDEASAREIIGAAVMKCGADAVTITRMVRAESAQRVVPGETYVTPVGYRGFYPYYYASYQVVSTPGYVVEDKIYVVETNLYDVATEGLVWTGISETLNPESAAQGIDSVGYVILSRLKQEGLISK